jgi:NAD(P)H-hydrate epimerase
MELTEFPCPNSSSLLVSKYPYLFQILNKKTLIRYFFHKLLKKFLKQALNLGVKTTSDMNGFDIIIDALFGFNYDTKREIPALLRELSEISSSKVIISIDVPSGWGSDENKHPFWEPNYILSLGIPKESTKSFRGHHYLCCNLFYHYALQFFDVKVSDFNFTSPWIKI